jgi:tRNA dimethylallyltransferase
MNIIQIIGGPTASGKSARALAIAEKTGGVIINADAMQVYRELPILSAQPTQADLARAEHRLYGVFSAQESCSAGIWARLAEQEIRAAHAAGKLPVVVGGTGLYFKALMEGFSPIPGISPQAREAAQRLWDASPEEARARLMEQDAPTAQRLKPNDKQRHIRALEVLEATGTPLSYWQSLPRHTPFAREGYRVEIIDPSREELYTRCNTRFETMLEQGALEEVRALKRTLFQSPVPNPQSLLVTHTLGFRELSAHLNGDLPLETAISQSQQDTRNNAKRQTTWFKHQMKY